MNSTEDILICIAIGAGAYLLGMHYGLKKAAAQTASSSTAAASNEDAGMLWFAQYGRM